MSNSRALASSESSAPNPPPELRAVLTLARRRLMALCGLLILVALILRIVFYRLQLPDAAYTWTFCRLDSLAVGASVALAARNSHDWQMGCSANATCTISSRSAVGSTGSEDAIYSWTICAVVLAVQSSRNIVWRMFDYGDGRCQRRFYAPPCQFVISAFFWENMVIASVQVGDDWQPTVYPRTAATNK